MTEKSHLVQALGYQAIKAGFLVLYRSIFDLVRDFLHDEAVAGLDKMLRKFLIADLLRRTSWQKVCGRFGAEIQLDSLVE